MLYFQGKEWDHMEWQYGEMLTKHDVDIGALCPALALLKDFITTINYEGPMLLVSATKLALPLFLDTSTHPAQFFSIEYMCSIDTLINAHHNLTLSFLWSWDDQMLVGFKRACHLAKHTICTTPIGQIKELHTIYHQKQAIV